MRYRYTRCEATDWKSGDVRRLRGMTLHNWCCEAWYMFWDSAAKMGTARMGMEVRESQSDIVFTGPTIYPGSSTHSFTMRLAFCPFCGKAFRETLARRRLDELERAVKRGLAAEGWPGAQYIFDMPMGYGA